MDKGKCELARMRQAGEEEGEERGSGGEREKEREKERERERERAIYSHHLDVHSTCCRLLVHCRHPTT